MPPTANKPAPWPRANPPPPPDKRDHRGKKRNLICLGHFWYTNVCPPPPSSSNTSLPAPFCGLLTMESPDVVEQAKVEHPVTVACDEHINQGHQHRAGPCGCGAARPFDPDKGSREGAQRVPPSPHLNLHRTNPKPCRNAPC